jgi:hypothetical protein
MYNINTKYIQEIPKVFVQRYISICPISSAAALKVKYAWVRPIYKKYEQKSSGYM